MLLTGLATAFATLVPEAASAQQTSDQPNVAAATPSSSSTTGTLSAVPASDAQSASPAHDNPSAPDRLTPVADSDVQEIVVTAQKRTENVQDVPKAVQVISQALLSQAGVTSLQDLGRVSPSIQGAVATPTAPPAIRGIASFALSIGVQTKTGVVLDDVPLASFSTIANELTDIERVEVLPGPQSTLSGRNAAGGLINIVTHNPTRTFEGKFNIEQTGDRQTRIGGFFSGPISDTLGFSLSGFFDRWAGPIRNVAYNNKRLGGFNQRGIRGKVQWRPTDSLTATLTGYYTKSTYRTLGLIGGLPYVAAAPGAGSVFFPGTPLEQLHPGATIGEYSTEVSTPGNGLTKNINKGATFRLDYENPLGTLSSITSYSRSTQPRTDLFVGYRIGGQVAYAFTDVRVNYTTQEVRLASPGSSDKFQYLLGAIYSDTDNFQPYVRSPVFPVNWDRSATVKSAALFGRATYKVLPDTSLTGGLRYQHDRLGYRFTFVDGSGTSSQGKSGYGFLAGEASLQHEFTPDIKSYLTYSNSHSGEAYDLEDNIGAASPGGLRPVASEKVQNYEAGLKTQWFDRRLTVNLSIFRANYDNYQVQSLQQSNGDVSQTPTIRLFSVGSVRTQGVELSSSITPVRSLRLGLDAIYLDARVQSYPGAQCYVGQTEAQGCVDAVQNRRGPLPNTSKFRATASANYTIALPSLPFDGTLGAFYRYQTATNFNLFGDPLARQGSFGILNLTAGVRQRGGKFTAEIFVNNVFNRHYYAQVTRDGFSPVPALTALYARDSSRYIGGRIGISF